MKAISRSSVWLPNQWEGWKEPLFLLHSFPFSWEELLTLLLHTPLGALHCDKMEDHWWWDSQVCNQQRWGKIRWIGGVATRVKNRPLSFRFTGCSWETKSAMPNGCFAALIYVSRGLGAVRHVRSVFNVAWERQVRGQPLTGLWSAAAGAFNQIFTLMHKPGISGGYS